MKELKPCPFCNGKAEIVEHSFGTLPPSYGVRCVDCRAETWQLWKTKELAVGAWNGRQEPVRCKDCAKTWVDDTGAIYCRELDRWEMPPDGYCHLGERK